MGVWAVRLACGYPGAPDIQWDADKDIPDPSLGTFPTLLPFLQLLLYTIQLLVLLLIPSLSNQLDQFW